MFGLKVVETRVAEADKRQKSRRNSGLDIKLNSWEARKEYAKVFVEKLSNHVIAEFKDKESIAYYLDQITTSSVARLEEGLGLYCTYCDFMAIRENELEKVALELETESDAEKKRTIKICKAELDKSAKEYKKASAKVYKEFIYECAFEETALIYEAVEEIFMTSGLQGEIEEKNRMYDCSIADIMKVAKIKDTIEQLASKQVSIDRRMENPERNNFSAALVELPKDYQF